MQVSNYVFNPIKALAEDFLTLKSIKHIKDKVEVIINSSCETEVLECKEEVEVSTPIELKNLTYTYDGGNIGLKNINFQFEKGKKYALVGSSGSGKSTLVKLIMKYYNDYDGEILVGNKSLKHIDKSSLYKYYSIIPQKVMLFNDTLKNNISMFQTYSDEDIYNVIRDVNLEHIVKDLPDELNTIVSESGNNFSGGEQQRISLARSFLKNSDVMLIDEATSSLDNKNSNQIEELILQRDNLTAIVVTHKLNENILKKYDCIVLLNDGAIAEYGSFTELMDRKEYFYSLYTLNSLHSHA
ncbi:MAG: ATP-binding cassette domain-containing protein [Paraclostridium sp.]